MHVLAVLAVLVAACGASAAELLWPCPARYLIHGTPNNHCIWLVDVVQLRRLRRKQRKAASKAEKKRWAAEKEAVEQAGASCCRSSGRFRVA